MFNSSMDFVQKAGAGQGDGSLAAVRLRRTVHEQQTGVRSGCGGNQDLKQSTKSGVIWSVRKFISHIKGSSASPSCSLNLCPYSCRTEAIKMAPAITLKLSLCSVTWCMLWGCPQVGKTENTKTIPPSTGDEQGYQCISTSCLLKLILLR